MKKEEKLSVEILITSGLWSLYFWQHSKLNLHWIMCY